MRSGISVATASAGDAPGRPASSATNEVIAVRGFLWCHAAMVVVLTAIRFSIDGPSAWPAIPLSAVAVGVAVASSRTERSGREVEQWMWLLLAGSWLGLVAVDWLFLQAMFTLFPVTYAIVDWPRAVLASALLPVTWGVVEFTTDEPFWEWGLLPTGTWILSCLLGWWILRVIDQSEERAAILAQLEATRAELAAAQRAEGARAERDRIARDIHDTLAQGFSSIVLHARGALAQDDPVSARRTLELVEQVAAEHLGEARRLVATASHAALGGRTLAEALQRVADADVPRAHVHLDGDGRRVSGAIEVAVLRITQEAVANARKHAEASRIDVTLSYTDREVLLDVVDDGAGFDLASPPVGDSPQSGFGLAGIRARVEELGGSVVVESERGAGTSVSVALPTGAG